MVPAEVERLFWDVDPSTIDPVRDADYVMERVMTRGGLVAMRWLVATYPRDALAEFLGRKAERLAPRERAFWALIAGVAAPAVPGGGRPTWAG